MEHVKHTAGPWKSDEHSIRYSRGPTNLYGDGAHICEVTNGMRNTDRGVSQTEAIANARLIQASPDAHRILQHLLDYITPGEPLIYFDGLMPDDGYDGAEDGQTLADAVKAYFAKVEGTVVHATK